MPFFTILDRYIFKELLGPFIFGIAAFTCILAGSSVLFYLVGDAIKYGIPLMQVIQLFIYKLPSVVVFTFPMSMLLATILAFGRLSSDLEILALRAGGVGFYRIVVSVFAMGFLVSGLTVLFNEAVVPQATYSGQLLMHQYTEKKDPTIKQHINLTEYDEKGLPRRIVNVREVMKGKLQGVTLAEYEHGYLIRVMSAASGAWVPTGGWNFYNGVMHHFSEQNPFQVTVIQFQKEYIDIPIDPQAQTHEKAPEEMNSQELKQRIAFQERTGEDPIQNLMKFHMKFSVPFASLIFAILGAAVGVRPHRSSSALGLGISLVIILIYYILLSVGMGLGIGHVIPPLIAAWFPNLIIGTAGLVLLRRVAF